MLLCDTGVSAQGEGLELPFLGRRLRATTGAAWLAKRTGAPILPAIMRWEADGTHRLRIEPEVQARSRPDDPAWEAEVMGSVHAVLERAIALAPAQWFKWKDLHDMSTASPAVRTPRAASPATA
jgi:lauroyl/myristoyl acyltransferase